MRVGVDTGEVVVSTLGERGDEARLRRGRPDRQPGQPAPGGGAGRQGAGLGGDPAAAARGVRRGGPRRPLPQGHRRAGGRLSRRSASAAAGSGSTRRRASRASRPAPSAASSSCASSRTGCGTSPRTPAGGVVTVIGDGGRRQVAAALDFDAWLAERPEAVWWFRGRASPADPQQPQRAAARHGVHPARHARRRRRPTYVRRAFVDGFDDRARPGRGSAARPCSSARGWGTTSVSAADELPTRPAGAARPGHPRRWPGYFARAQPAGARSSSCSRTCTGPTRAACAGSTPRRPMLRDATVLVVATARPDLLEARPRWGEGLAHHVRLDLDAALATGEPRAACAQILARVERPAGRARRPGGRQRRGQPVLHRGAGHLADRRRRRGARRGRQWHVVDELVGTVAVPSTLKGVLQSRLDALTPAERDLLQRASVVGRVFWDSALVAARRGPAGTRPRSTALLEGLRRREVLLEREVSRFDGAREFLFKHALLRDVAYDGVLRAHRERYHRPRRRLAGRDRGGDRPRGGVRRRDRRAPRPGPRPGGRRRGTSAPAARRPRSTPSRRPTRLLGRAPELVADDDTALRFDVLADARGAARPARRPRARSSEHLDGDARARRPTLDPPRRVAAAAGAGPVGLRAQRVRRGAQPRRGGRRSWPPRSAATTCAAEATAGRRARR